MLEGFIAGLFVAFVLTVFSVDVMILEVLNSFGSSIIFTTSHYYIMFGLIGLISGAFKSIP